MKKLAILFAVLSLLLLGTTIRAFAQGSPSLVPFGGNLDRPVSTADADNQEANSGADDEIDPGDDDDDEDDDIDFIDEPLEGHKFVLVLDRSCSMYSGYNAGFPVYDENGNLISYPNRWQTTQSEASSCVNAMTEDDSFDIITYATSIYICFGSLVQANPSAKAQAIGWIYSQNPTGCTNSYDALKAAFTNYGAVDTIVFMSDGMPNTALSLGCSACACWSWIGSRILNDATGWIQNQVSANSNFKFLVIQIGPPAMSFMQQLGAKQNSSFHLK